MVKIYSRTGTASSEELIPENEMDIDEKDKSNVNATFRDNTEQKTLK
jgi:hypothetical protein